jgi:hypothetical protein
MNHKHLKLRVPEAIHEEARTSLRHCQNWTRFRASFSAYRSRIQDSNTGDLGMVVIVH